MYTMMIVDDEPSSRQGLCECFPWHEYGIDIIAQAKDGLEAKEVLSTRKPDIILTDIRMPKMDGIELSTFIRKEHRGIKIVFISGYDDLNYFKAAMKLDATDYIIKPINFAELSEVLRKVIHELDAEKQYNQTLTNVNKKMDLSIPLLKDKLFLDLLLRNDCPENSVHSILEITEMQITNQTKFCILMISPDNEFDILPSKENHPPSAFRQPLLVVCQNYKYYPRYRYNIHYLEMVNGDTAAIVYPLSVQDKPDIITFADDIRKHVSLSLNTTATVAVSDIAEGPLTLHSLYLHAVMTLERRFSLGGNRVILYEIINTVPQRAAITLKWEDRLDKTLATGDQSEIDLFIKEFWDDILLMGTLELSAVRQICHEIFFMTRRYIHSLPAPDLDMEITEMENCILQINTIEGIKKHLSHYFLVVSSHMREQLEDPSALVVKQVCDIIHERYADNLTVQDIADQVYLTVPYSCTIFKREMGLTINEYLVRTRIENSKTLLSNPRYKLYEVSNAVGYQDPAYFAKQFKKHTGYTPREFRSMNIGNRTESGEYV